MTIKSQNEPSFCPKSIFGHPKSEFFEKQDRYRPVFDMDVLKYLVQIILPFNHVKSTVLQQDPKT